MWKLKLESRTAAALGLVCGLVLSTLMVIFFFLEDKPEYSAHRIFQYGFNIRNTGNELLQDIEFAVYAPVKRTANQLLLQLDTTHPYELVSDELGNQVLKFRFDNIAPYETRIVRIKVELAFADNSNPLPNVHPGEFLAPEKYIETDEPLLIKRAHQLQAGPPLATARKAYEWVSGYLEYKGYIEEDRGALSAFQSRQGDCTEYMYLFNAMARINGIPARSVGGYVYSESAVFRARDYHNWSEIFIDGRWMIVDPQKKSFFENPSHYIAMRIISAESTALLGNSHRFAYSADPRLAVSML